MGEDTGERMEFVKGHAPHSTDWLCHLLCGFEQLPNLSSPRFLHL